MRTRTRNLIAFVAFAAATSAGLALAARTRGRAGLGAMNGTAIDAIPNGALVVATADVARLRNALAFAAFLQRGREIQGVGKVKDVCGFDPIDQISDVALGIPAAGEGGDFGLAATGSFDDEALVACASKVVEKRGGRPVVVPRGTFRVVRDAASSGGGEIAVRHGGPLLLGAGVYLNAMIEAAEGRSPSIRASVAHEKLAIAVGPGALRLTFVLSPEQRKSIGGDVARGSSIAAGGVSVELGAAVALHAVLACDDATACAELASSLISAKQAHGNDVALRLVGFGAVLDRLTIEPEGPLVHARVELAPDEASKLIDTALKLRGLRHPMPDEAAAPLEPRPTSGRPASTASAAAATSAAPPPALPAPPR